MRHTLAILALLLFAGVSRAQITAGELKDKCGQADAAQLKTHEEVTDFALCIGYISGVLETATAMVAYDGKKTFYNVLLGEDVTVAQIARLFAIRIKDDPESWSQPASLTVIGYAVGAHLVALRPIQDAPQSQ
jgi:hypothetical protein